MCWTWKLRNVLSESANVTRHGNQISSNGRRKEGNYICQTMDLANFYLLFCGSRLHDPWDPTTLSLSFQDIAKTPRMENNFQRRPRRRHRYSWTGLHCFVIERVNSGTRSFFRPLIHSSIRSFIHSSLTLSSNCCSSPNRFTNNSFLRNHV